MRVSIIQCFASCAALLMTQPVLAQEPVNSSGPAPKVNVETTQAGSWPSEGDRYFVLYIDAWETWQDEDGEKIDRLRRARPIDPPQSWFHRDDPAIASRLDSPAQQASYAHMSVEVGPDGDVISCEEDAFRGAKPDEDLLEGACKLLSERARFMPALDHDGQRTNDYYRVSLTFTVASGRNGTPPPAISERKPSPAPMAPFTGFDKSSNWPVTSTHVLYLLEPTLAKPVPRGSNVNRPGPDETATGFYFKADSSGRTDCFIQPGGTDDGICREALRLLQPQWTNSGYGSTKEYPMLAVRKGKSVRYIAPNRSAQWRPSFSSSQARTSFHIMETAVPDRAARDRLRLMLDVASDGSVSSCRIVTSTGDDALDFAACAAAKAEVTATPCVDVFGQPYGDARILWSEREILPKLMVPPSAPK